MSISTTITHQPKVTEQKVQNRKENLADLHEYYVEAGPDYKAWSDDFNMHFGYIKGIMDFFKRDVMLNEMNAQILERLNIDEQAYQNVADLGCGTGAASRYMAQSVANKQFHCVTNVPWQIKKGMELCTEKQLQSSIHFKHGNYTDTHFKEHTFDAAFAIESCCHASGIDKKDFIQEADRVLKPNAKLIIADCFVKNQSIGFDPITRYAYDAICENWAMEDMIHIEPFVEQLKSNGFTNIQVEDVSWRVAPSVFHVPWVSLKFVVQSLLKGEKLTKQRINNVKGSLLSLLIGLNRLKFSYCIVSATKV